ncbi:DUF7594 domain-containing protein [Sinomicrobium weinanense]|uniref:DNRLRE domain-containing protein n=1 Tax=Sinomicrobium weinanense TaxID=2842200 RepID=A0A926JV59_9FLAO|nr:DNRLRE domain-containing protein [Sinomicrobium weinanense]MBC9797751.1 DNRLRE domain-containing protein [Sinomicrobium weinanense]MBU3125984.1 DNRLRE domain-containing protein [Sinomicrobium weinanense]
MKIISKYYKNLPEPVPGCVFALLLVLLASCGTDDNPSYGMEREPGAAIGFLQDTAVVQEGEVSPEIYVGVSKRLFNRVSFEVVADSSDVEGDVFMRPEGHADSLFSIESNQKMMSFVFIPKDDKEYNGNKDGIRKVKVVLRDLEGDGAFLVESNKGSKDDNNQIFAELTIDVLENEPIPPFIQFAKGNGKVQEDSPEPAKVTLALSEATSTSGTLGIKISGTAVAGTDFTTAFPVSNGYMQLPYTAGATEIEFGITPVDNEEITGNKTVVLRIDDIGKNLFPGNIMKYELEIVDDDLPTKVSGIPVEADAWTRGRNGSGNSDDNGGSKTSLVASDGNSDNDFREFYLKFDLEGTDPEKIIDARVVLTTIRESNWEGAETNYGGPTTQSLYYVSDDSWEEMTITANTKPASETDPLATFTSNYLISSSSDSNIEHDFDVTERLQAETDGKLSVRLTTVNTLGQRIFYASKETGEQVAPKLIITERLD